MQTFFRIVSLLMVLSIYACGDSCDGVECGPGTCEDGTCICPDGLDGASCDITVNSVYYGDYLVVDPTCGTTNNTTTIEAISIAAHPNGNPTEVQVTASTSSITSTIDGTIVNTNFEAEGPFSSFTLEISGIFSDTDNFVATIGGAGLICRDVTYAK